MRHYCYLSYVIMDFKTSGYYEAQTKENSTSKDCLLYIPPFSKQNWNAYSEAFQVSLPSVNICDVIHIFMTRWLPSGIIISIKNGMFYTPFSILSEINIIESNVQPIIRKEGKWGLPIYISVYVQICIHIQNIYCIYLFNWMYFVLNNSRLFGTSLEKQRYKYCD